MPPGRYNPLAQAAPLEHAADHALTIPTPGGPVSIPIPKDPVANLDWRAFVLESAERDSEYQATLRGLVSQPCADSLLLWINLFAFTYRVQDTDPEGNDRPVTGAAMHAPFVTWPYQDRLFRELHEAISKGRDFAVDKTRKMGLSWVILTAFHWFWQFQPGSHLQEMSREEALVDNGEDPDSLMWKHDYLNKRQPGWLLPRINRSHLHMANLTLGCTIIGQATSEHKGHGGRKLAALFDEASRMRNFRSVWEGASQLTSCRIANSTPHGPGYYSELIRSGKVRTLRAPFYEHPQFGRGRYATTDKGSGKIIISSPWRDRQVERAVSRREIAENIDMDHAGAGLMFFDADVLSRKLSTEARAPDHRGDLVIIDGEMVYRENPHGAWSFWLPLKPDEEGKIRPPQTLTYVGGCDISAGQAMSNSTCSVKCVEHGAKVAECATGTLMPEEFASHIDAAGRWFGGGNAGCMFLLWEANGPGGIFGKMLVHRLGYPWYFRQLSDNKVSMKTDVRYGWHSSRQAKEDLLADYRRALAQDRYINPSESALMEAMTYVYMESGEIGPGQLEDESPMARGTHGDRVIGDALSEYGSLWCGRMDPAQRVAPPGSPAERRERAKARETGKATSYRPKW